MNIILLSDSHEKSQLIADIVSLYEKTADMIIHLGDYIRDIEYAKSIYPKLKFEILPGNGDSFSILPQLKIIEISGFRILLTHGHIQKVKQGLSRLYDFCRENGCNAAFYGHTHIANYENHNGITLINPGSVQSGKYAYVEIKNDSITPNFYKY